ncbi:hypothetical protein BPC006_II0861 [Burkholderia pseudomallei BPC006]|nr:hypothetical protein BPC006_II0861 [Burkholderia pseudomallei BPC006]
MSRTREILALWPAHRLASMLDCPLFGGNLIDKECS